MSTKQSDRVTKWVYAYAYASIIGIKLMLLCAAWSLQQ